MTFWKATYETRNFTFEAFGRTQREAHDALRLGWKRHKSQCSATGTIYADDIQFLEFDLGECYRDSQSDPL